MSVRGNYVEVQAESLDSFPVPSNTRTWTLTPQSSLVKEAQRALSERDLEFNTVTHLVHRKRPVFITEGTVVGKSIDGLQGESWTLAVMNSYDKSISARVVFGRKVFICSNGIIHADRMLGTKHTGQVWSRLAEMLADAVDDFVNNHAIFSERQRVLKERYFSNEQLATFALQLVSVGVLPKAKAYDLYSEAKSPSFAYGTNPMCLWNVQAAFTHLSKSLEPISRSRSNISFEKVLDSWVGVASA